MSSRTSRGASRVHPEWFWMHVEHPWEKYFRAQNHHFRAKYFPSCRVLFSARSRNWTPAVNRQPGFPPGRLVKVHLPIENTYHRMSYACRNPSRTSPRHDFGNIFGEKFDNFQMSECHVEQLSRLPECPLSDSECLWNILGRNISEPKNMIFTRKCSIMARSFPHWF